MREDRQEQELNSATDCEWIRALDAQGKSIKIKKTDLIELIRGNMPVATDFNNGLFNKSWMNKVVSRTVDMVRDETYSFQSGGYFVALISNSINGNSAIIVFSYFHIHIFGSDSDFSNKDVEGKICIFKQENGIYVLKNRMYDLLRVFIEIL